MAKKATASRSKKSPRAGRSAPAPKAGAPGTPKGKSSAKKASAGSPKVAKSVKSSGSVESAGAKAGGKPRTSTKVKSEGRARSKGSSKAEGVTKAGAKASVPARGKKAPTDKATEAPAKKASVDAGGATTKKTPARTGPKAGSPKAGTSPEAGIVEKAVGGDAKSGSKTTKKVVPSKGAPEPAAPEGEARKGITVVAKKQSRRSRPAVAGTYMLPSGGFKTLGATFGKPLIPSGPGAVLPSSLAVSGDGAKRKSPFNKRELAKFRRILEEKRDELSGAVSDLDVQTQRTGSSETSKSQALDDQGSEAADQALSLDLVAAERRLLSEIIAAIRRIDEGTYGICELTGKPIRVERLEELPWTRYSIDAARELERRQLRT